MIRNKIMPKIESVLWGASIDIELNLVKENSFEMEIKREHLTFDCK